VSSVKQAHAPSGLQMTAVLDSDSITEILLWFWINIQNTFKT
jgi:hypothetical protein